MTHKQDKDRPDSIGKGLCTVRFERDDREINRTIYLYSDDGVEKLISLLQWASHNGVSVSITPGGRHV